jgi:hypothetical protein
MASSCGHSVVQVVHLLSGVFGHSIALMSSKDTRYLQCSEHFSIISSSACYASCVGCLTGYFCPPHGTHFPSSLNQNFATFKYTRPPAGSVRRGATTRLKTFLNVSKAISKRAHLRGGPTNPIHGRYYCQGNG